MRQLRVLSLCTGICGFERAQELVNAALRPSLGFEFFVPVAFSEIDPYCVSVEAHFYPHVPQLGAIQNVSNQLISRRIAFDALCGGIPCQPFSEAGEKMGSADERDLWPDTFAIIRKHRPMWTCLENVGGFAGHDDGLSRVARDLESEGYSVGSVKIPACSIGASHKRMRTFILAHTHDSGTKRLECEQSSSKRARSRTQFDGRCGAMANTKQFQSGQRRDANLLRRCSRNSQQIRMGHCRSRGNKETGAPDRAPQPSVGERADESATAADFSHFDFRLLDFDTLAAGIINSQRQPALMGERQYPWEPPRLAPKGDSKLWKQQLSALGNAIVPAQAAMPLLALAIAELQTPS